MKDTPKPLKIFLDTSVLLSGLNSPFGASGFILSLFKLKKINIIISQEVINEAQEVIKLKFPLLRIPFLDFLLEKPTIIAKLTPQEMKSAYNKIISTEDTPIIAGALKAGADCLITLDKKFQRLAVNKVKPEMLLPSEFLQKYKKIIMDTGGGGGGERGQGEG